MYYYIALGVVVVLVLWVVGSYVVVRNIEQPAYTVLEKRDGYEVRMYNPYIVAETNVGGEYQEAMSSGFSIIADYIFGNNTAKASIAMTAPVLETRSEKIAMTAPVISTATTTEGHVIAFVLPSSYTLESLPQPNNTAVELREVPSRKVAARRFTWYATEMRIAAQTKFLEEKLVADGLRATDTAQVAQYNPPLSFPLTRRNEIIIPVE
jgi:hypothetical protein